MKYSPNNNLMGFDAVKKSSAPKFAKRLGDALFELENMQVAYQADRELQVSIVEKYKFEKGKRFERAQKAAVRGDEDALKIGQIEERKKKVLDNLAKVWGIFTGDEKAGYIIAEYLRKDGNVSKLESKYSAEEIAKAVSLWKKYYEMTTELAATRFLEKYRRIRANKRQVWKAKQMYKK